MTLTSEPKNGKMPEFLKIFLISAFTLFAAGEITAVLFYLVIFPLANKFLHKDFPTFDFNFPDEVGLKENLTDKQSKVDKKEKPKNEMPIKNKQAKLSSKPKPAKAEKGAADNAKADSKTEAVKRTRYIDLHKDVPTVRLPTFDTSKKQKTLTLAQIDAAAKKAKVVNPYENESTEIGGETVELPIFTPIETKEESLPKKKSTSKTKTSSQKNTKPTKAVKTTKTTNEKNNK